MGKKPNITYLLGAGASFGTIPILNEISVSMFKQAQMLKSVGTLTGNLSSVLHQYISSLEWLSEEGKSHNTVDTLAKKYFLNDETKKLDELKATISLFFIILQFHDGTNKSQKKKPNIHQRYTSLISAFLEKDADGNIHLPENVRFVSWNYDYQLELALQNFNSSPKSYPNSTNNTYKDYPSIVHLNGIAGLFSEGNNFSYVFDRITHAFLRELLENILPIYERMSKPGSSNFNFNRSFTYIWESNDLSKKAKEMALNVFKNTEYLIIIGYSFPVFNREFDRQLLSGRTFKKIYYQDLTPDRDSLAATFNLDISKIHPITKVDQFFLPFEF